MADKLCKILRLDCHLLPRTGEQNGSAKNNETSTSQNGIRINLNLTLA